MNKVDHERKLNEAFYNRRISVGKAILESVAFSIVFATIYLLQFI